MNNLLLELENHRDILNREIDRLNYVLSKNKADTELKYVCANHVTKLRSQVKHINQLISQYKGGEIE